MVFKQYIPEIGPLIYNGKCVGLQNMYETYDNLLQQTTVMWQA